MLFDCSICFGKDGGTFVTSRSTALFLLALLCVRDSKHCSACVNLYDWREFDSGMTCQTRFATSTSHEVGMAAPTVARKWHAIVLLIVYLLVWLTLLVEAFASLRQNRHPKSMRCAQTQNTRTYSLVTWNILAPGSSALICVARLICQSSKSASISASTTHSQQKSMPFTGFRSRVRDAFQVRKLQSTVPGLDLSMFDNCGPSGIVQR
jgi:hypothetical protein